VGSSGLAMHASEIDEQVVCKLSTMSGDSRSDGHHTALISQPKHLSVSRNYPGAYLNLAAALAQFGRLDEARSAAKAGLAVNPAFTVSRTHRAWTAMSDDTTYLAQLERRLFGGLRKAELLDGDKTAILHKPAVQPQCAPAPLQQSSA
jgi:hypothetical protein